MGTEAQFFLVAPQTSQTTNGQLGMATTLGMEWLN